MSDGQSATGVVAKTFAEIPDTPDVVGEAAYILAEVVDTELVDWDGSGRTGPVATSCIYVADRAIRQENSHTQGFLCRHAPATQPTIRRHYHLVPTAFFDHATDEHKADLDSIGIDDESYPKYGWSSTVTVLDMLRVFEAAERSEISLVDINPWIDPDAVCDLADAITRIHENE